MDMPIHVSSALSSMQVLDVCGFESNANEVSHAEDVVGRRRNGRTARHELKTNVPINRTHAGQAVSQKTKANSTDDDDGDDDDATERTHVDRLGTKGDGSNLHGDLSQPEPEPEPEPRVVTGYLSYRVSRCMVCSTGEGAFVDIGMAFDIWGGGYTNHGDG